MQIHEAVPSDSLLLVVLGYGDLSLVKRQVAHFFYPFSPNIIPLYSLPHITFMFGLRILWCSVGTVMVQYW